MRGKVKTLLECLHLLLIVTIAVPASALYRPDFEMRVLYPLYMYSFLLIVSIVCMKFAGDKCRNWFVYMLSGLGTYLGVQWIANQIAKSVLAENVRFHYLSSIFVISLILVIDGIRVRILRAKKDDARLSHDMTWTEAYLTLDKPKTGFAAWFLLVYGMAKFTVSPQVCNLAVIHLILYLAVNAGYIFMDKNENYLRMNEKLCNVRNIPHKRIFGIGRVFLLIYISLLLLVLIPAVLTMGSRTYYDVREWKVGKPIETIEPQMDQMYKEISGYMPMEVSEPTAFTKFLNVLFIIFGSGALLFGICFLIKEIWAELKMFEEGMNQEEDKIESLQEEEAETLPTQKVSDVPKEEMKIRRVYRKFIRKHRKDRPAVYETPSEIEAAAGVADTPEGQRLHEAYELARYGRI